MAEQYTDTLDGLLLINDNNLADYFTSNILDSSPVIKNAFAQVASDGGITHKYTRETAAPGSGFRAIGSGLNNAAGKEIDVTVNLKYLDGSFSRDIAAARAYRKGVDAYLQREGGKSLRAAFFNAERALFNPGVSGAFDGFRSFDEYKNTSGSKGSQCIFKGATTGAHSVWLIRWDETAASILVGNEGAIAVSDAFLTEINDGHGNTLTAYRVDIGAYLGLQVGCQYDAVRISGLDGSAGKSLTDDLIADAISMFKADSQPNMIVMNRTALKELRESRTATSTTGAPAEFPEISLKVPIVVTDALTNTETQDA